MVNPATLKSAASKERFRFTGLEHVVEEQGHSHIARARDEIDEVAGEPQPAASDEGD